MRNKKSHSGFTLLEALIAASIFAMVSMMGAAIFINISQSERKTELTNALYEDARVIMETLAREIRSGTIDYEEYYNKHVLCSTLYGVNRGVYASRFYDPGFYLDAGVPKKGTNPEHLGVQTIPPSEMVFPLSVDKNMGQNPYSAAEPANALSDNIAINCPSKAPDELHLISSDGRIKTTLVRQQMNDDDYALSMLRMESKDLDNNGVTDIFSCTEEYKEYCTSATDGEIASEFTSPFDIPTLDSAEIKLPSDTDKGQFAIATSAFVPISPLRSSIKNLRLIISPVEDPYKAFAETLVQYQPNVTIVLTLVPSAEEMTSYPSETTPEITIQTTVSTGVHQKITTYPPTKELDWIEDALTL